MYGGVNLSDSGELGHRGCLKLLASIRGHYRRMQVARPKSTEAYLEELYFFNQVEYLSLHDSGVAEKYGAFMEPENLDESERARRKNELIELIEEMINWSDSRKSIVERSKQRLAEAS